MNGAVEKNKSHNSIESILKSVRSVIDNHEKDVKSSTVLTESSEDSSSDDVLELTSVVEEDSSESSLISEKVRQHASKEISKFASAAQKESSDDGALQLTIEKIARPLIKTWIDKHLVTIVERVLKEEIKKIMPK
ncbi:MAG TPA: DUF2497 domain-containing protein [Candidatus Megaira endosymbiont of Nemacystus decipiens]|nr:DUF2497 domain-containing protein [Candidatus Megaera endosymbiont of Nemacystus decipiens]